MLYRIGFLVVGSTGGGLDAERATGLVLAPLQGFCAFGFYQGFALLPCDYRWKSGSVSGSSFSTASSTPPPVAIPIPRESTGVEIPPDFIPSHRLFNLARISHGVS